MGDVTNVGDLVSNPDLLCPFRQLLSMLDLKTLAFVLWQIFVFCHFFHKQPYIVPESLFQLQECRTGILDCIVKDRCHERRQIAYPAYISH